MTIIERDLAFYEAEYDDATDNLRRCLPRDEPYWAARQIAAAGVVIALRKLQAAYPSPTRSAAFRQSAA